MIGVIPRDDKGKILLPVSSYQPFEDVIKLQVPMMEDFSVAWNILHRPYDEFIRQSVVGRMNIDRKKFEQWVEDWSDDPDEYWRSNLTTALTRNKVIGTAAQVTAKMFVMRIFAQDMMKNLDKDASLAMNEIAETIVRNSKYSTEILKAVIYGLVHPLSFLSVEFNQVMQRIKEEGTGRLLEILDEELSGIKFKYHSCSEILLTNAYEPNIQLQRGIFRVRNIELSEAKQLYGNHPNFEFVMPGKKNVFDNETALFYELEDENQRTTVQEAIGMYRTDDMEVPYVNGVYLGDDNTRLNRMRHRDYKGRPKYHYVKFGYEQIENFAYFKSLAFKLANEQVEADTVARMIIDDATYNLDPAIAATGTDKIDSGVFYPGAKVAIESADAKITPLLKGSDFQRGFQVLQDLRNQASESSQDPIRMGQIEKGVTAFQVARAEQNAIVQLGPFGKVLAEAVTDLGGLLIDTILNHMLVSEYEELVSGAVRIRFNQFLIPDRVENGTKFSRKIIVTDEYARKRMNDAELLDVSFGILKAEKYDGDTRIIKLNPYLLSKYKYYVIIDADSFLPRNEMLEKALKFEARDRLITSPLVAQNPEGLRNVETDLLIDAMPETRGKAERYLGSATNPILEALAASGQGKPQTGARTNLVQQMTGNNALRSILTTPGQ